MGGVLDKHSCAGQANWAPLGSPFCWCWNASETLQTDPSVAGAFQAAFAVVVVGGQAVAPQVRVVVDGRGNVGKADGVARGPGKDEGQDQQGVKPAGLGIFLAKLAAGADRKALKAMNLGVFNNKPT